MNEEKLDAIGAEPLVHFVQTLRKLFRGNTTEITDTEGQDIKDKKGLTAALSFLHSRGVDALFGFGIEGDVGVDPNYMTLWFSQPSLGLPSKVSPIRVGCKAKDSSRLRNTTKRSLSRKYISSSSNDCF